MITALVCGAGAGAGVWLVARGARPPRPSLAQTLARLRTIPTQPTRAEQPADGGGWAARLGRPFTTPLRRGGETRLLGRWVRADLAILGRSPERHLAEKTTLGLLGLLLAPACAALLALGGVAIPLAVPLWAAALCAAGLFVLPDAGIHTDAQARRHDFRHALSAFLDLVVISLSAGAGVETALVDAADVGDGWAFDQLRDTLHTSRLTRQTPWSAFAALGQRLGVGELGELAASVALAGTEGAKVRASLLAKATSLRTHQLAEAEARAQAATERMSLPVVLLFAGFLCFIAYPAIDRILTGL